MGSVNSVDGEKAGAASAAVGNHGLATPQPPPQRPPPRPQRQSMRPQQLAALVPSPSPEAAEGTVVDDSSTLLGDDDLDRIETPVTPKQGRTTWLENYMLRVSPLSSSPPSTVATPVTDPSRS